MTTIDRGGAGRRSEGYDELGGQVPDPAALSEMQRHFDQRFRADELAKLRPGVDVAHDMFAALAEQAQARNKGDAAALEAARARIAALQAEAEHGNDISRN